jgi:predicted regulator of Ras-like GTPase activity (Roadblock/LC7/MglB family)
MPDDIRSLTAALARDPKSLVYADLAEALRRRGQRQEALQVVLQGLTRHPMHADGHDCLARVYADLGDLERARLAWSKALEIAPDHMGSLRGVAFLLFRQGDLAAAESALQKVLARAPWDEGARSALAGVRAGRGAGGAGATGAAPGAVPAQATPSPAAQRPEVFYGFDGASADILLLDQRGRVLAGGLTDVEGKDASELAAAALAGVSGEAARTAEYLGLEAWSAIVAEAEHSNLVVAPVGEEALLLVRRDRSMAVGLALRFAERARGIALAWLKGQGA